MAVTALDDGYEEEDEPIDESSSAVREYRTSGPARLLVVAGSMILLAICGATALRLLHHPAEPAAWIGVTALVGLVVIAARRRAAQRASSVVRIDGESITAIDRLGFRSLPWELVARLRMTQWRGIELSNADRTLTISLTRRFEHFPTLAADVLNRLETSYEQRQAKVRRDLFEPRTFKASVIPEILEALGSIAFSASGAWWNLTGFGIGLLTMPVAFRRLGRMPYAVVAGRSITLRTLTGTREIPFGCVARVGFVLHKRAKAAIAIEDATGQVTLVMLSRLTEQPLELYDRLRWLRDAAAQKPTVDEPITRLMPVQAAIFAAGCVIVAVATAWIPILNGRVLNVAARRGDVRLAHAALMLGSPVDFTLFNQTTPLYEAAKAGHLPVVTMLLARGADGTKQCRDMGFTPLHVAGEYGHVEIVRTLLHSGVPANVSNYHLQTPLWQIAWKKRPTDVEVATLLLDAGASIDAADRTGNTPLHVAVRYTNLPLVAYLAKRGARIDLLTHGQRSPIDLALANGCVECLRLLSTSGADLNQPDPEGRTALFNAAGRAEPNVVEVLLQLGAKPEIEAKDGFTALQVAAATGQLGAVAVLLRHHVDPNISNQRVPSPLYLAVQFGHRPVVGFLAKHGARPDMIWRDYTPLTRAAWQNDALSVGLILDGGADPNAASVQAMPPVVVAAERGNLDVVTLLLDRGADVNASHRGWSARRAARHGSHPKVVDYLLSRGAS